MPIQDADRPYIKREEHSPLDPDKMYAKLGYNQLIKKELTDPKLLHYQRAIENSGNLLLAIIKIQIEVRDTGIGMSKDFLPTLFDSFSRERNTTVGKVAGTGLGMAIVKRYVDLMGGSIDVKSELGKGLCLPLG